MAALNIHLADDIRARIESKAAESGFANVEAYVEAMLVAEAASPGRISDHELAALLRSRANGPFVDMDEADFQQMRRKLEKRLGVTRGSERP